MRNPRLKAHGTSAPALCAALFVGQKIEETGANDRTVSGVSLERLGIGTVEGEKSIVAIDRIDQRIGGFENAGPQASLGDSLIDPGLECLVQKPEIGFRVTAFRHVGVDRNRCNHPPLDLDRRGGRADDPFLTGDAVPHNHIADHPLPRQGAGKCLVGDGNHLAGFRIAGTDFVGSVPTSRFNSSRVAKPN